MNVVYVGRTIRNLRLLKVLNNQLQRLQPEAIAVPVTRACGEAAADGFSGGANTPLDSSCVSPPISTSNLSAGASYNMMTSTTTSGGGGSTQYRMGTSRYAAPEVLDGTLHREQFESFAAADMYSLALVIWEIATRTYCPGAEVDDQDLPYQEYLGTSKCNPNADEMRVIVCEQRLRPTVRSRWLSGNARMAKLIKLMVECWHEVSKHLQLPKLISV